MEQSQIRGSTNQSRRIVLKETTKRTADVDGVDKEGVVTGEREAKGNDEDESAA